MKKLLIITLSFIAVFTFVVSPLVVSAKTSTDLEDALNALRQARQAFKDARAQEVNEADKVAKAKVQAIREAAEKKRDEARARMETQRKDVLLKLVDLQVGWMQRTKERVQRMPNITDELKTKLSLSVDEAVAKLNELKTRVQAASGMEAIKKLVDEARALFKAKRDIAHEIVDAIHASRLEMAVSRAEDRAAAMKTKLEELKNKGKDTDDMEADLDETKNDVREAQVAVGRNAFREANDDLKGAYQKFRGIAEKARGLQ